MNILLLGPNGQVGWELQRSLAPLGHVAVLGRGDDELCGDLMQPDALLKSVRALRPDVIVNAAAYTSVDRAESEVEAARQVNALTPGLLAQEARQSGAWLVHFSTDYVFDGSGNLPHAEGDRTGPLNVYGQTKLEGEQRIAESGCRHLIFRTSWVYAARGGNFAKTMLRLASEREQLKIINDQTGAPTGAELLADVTAHALRVAAVRPDVSGLYHCTAGGATTWYDYARFVFEAAVTAGWTLKARNIAPVPTSAYPTPARRPLNSRLDTHRLRDVFGLELPDWTSGVSRMLTEFLDA